MSPPVKNDAPRLRVQPHYGGGGMDCDIYTYPLDALVYLTGLPPYKLGNAKTMVSGGAIIGATIEKPVSLGSSEPEHHNLCGVRDHLYRGGKNIFSADKLRGFYEKRHALDLTHDFARASIHNRTEQMMRGWNRAVGYVVNGLDPFHSQYDLRGSGPKDELLNGKDEGTKALSILKKAEIATKRLARAAIANITGAPDFFIYAQAETFREKQSELTGQRIGQSQAKLDELLGKKTNDVHFDVNILRGEMYGAFELPTRDGSGLPSQMRMEHMLSETVLMAAINEGEDNNYHRFAKHPRAVRQVSEYVAHNYISRAKVADAITYSCALQTMFRGPQKPDKSDEHYADGGNGYDAFRGYADVRRLHPGEQFFIIDLNADTEDKPTPRRERDRSHGYLAQNLAAMFSQNTNAGTDHGNQLLREDPNVIGFVRLSRATPFYNGTPLPDTISQTTSRFAKSIDVDLAKVRETHIPDHFDATSKADASDEMRAIRCAMGFDLVQKMWPELKKAAEIILKRGAGIDLDPQEREARLSRLEVLLPEREIQAQIASRKVHHGAPNEERNQMIHLKQPIDGPHLHLVGGTAVDAPRVA